MFKDRKLLIATKHKKEQVIAKPIEAALEVKCIVMEDYDTDELGTFTGEKERKMPPLETVRKKCLDAMDKYGFDLAIANEGSFGPHPALYFIPANEELMVLIDKKLKLEILVKNISTQTNFGGKMIHDYFELEQFAVKTQFPSHALILRKNNNSNDDIIKGISNWEALQFAYNNLSLKYGDVYAETDMRAMYNPTRMKVIEETTFKLIEAIQHQCPQCGTPGFMPYKFIPGLPCILCGLPTKSIKTEISKCKKCNYEMGNDYPKQKEFEDPQFCDYCNP